MTASVLEFSLPIFRHFIKTIPESSKLQVVSSWVGEAVESLNRNHRAQTSWQWLGDCGVVERSRDVGIRVDLDKCATDIIVKPQSIMTSWPGAVARREAEEINAEFRRAFYRAALESRAKDSTLHGPKEFGERI